MADALREQQFAFAAHLRDPARTRRRPPGIEDRRLTIYRDLFFNNIEGLLAGNFPVIRKTLGDERWRALVREFYASTAATRRCSPKSGASSSASCECDARAPDAAIRLAGANWRITNGWNWRCRSPTPTSPPHDPHGDLLAGVPVLSPLAWPLAYAWPVHAHRPGITSPTRRPERRPCCCCAATRDGDVRFAELSPLVFRLLELIDAQRDATAAAALAATARHRSRRSPTPPPSSRGHAMLARLHAEGVLLGTVPRC